MVVARVTYNIVFVAAFALALPYLLLRLALKRELRPLAGRLWLRPRKQVPAPGGRSTVWVHAVSVGEIKLAAPFVLSLLERLPGVTVALSASTVTGQRVAKSTFKDNSRVRCILFPLDLPCSVSRALDAVRPKLVVIFETELWPNFLLAAHTRVVPVVFLNGTITERSTRRLRRWLHSLISPALRDVAAFGVQTQADGVRFESFGARHDRIRITGSVKFDGAVTSVPEIELEEYRDLIGLVPGVKLMVAGSTRDGEEAIVLEAYDKLKGDCADLRLVIAPRHFDRLDSIQSLVAKHGNRCVLRSALPCEGLVPPVVILDTIGELTSFYALANLAVVGGGLIPSVGGHNPIEPAALGTPTVFGPHMEGCPDLVRVLRDNDACIQLADASELYEAARRILTDEAYALTLGNAGRAAVISAQGALDESLNLVVRHLPSGHEL